jgi:hypothetical protein
MFPATAGAAERQERGGLTGPFQPANGDPGANLVLQRPFNLFSEHLFSKTKDLQRFA